MKAQGAELMPIVSRILKGGSDSFFYKGTNGRWRDILTPDEIKLYDAACERELTSDCRRWLENGGEIG